MWKSEERPDQGSSPRIRGESAAVRQDRAVAGIIPANTGRIIYALPETRVGQDHPREYGENWLLLPPWSVEVGSSPRIRGE